MTAAAPGGSMGGTAAYVSGTGPSQRSALAGTAGRNLHEKIANAIGERVVAGVYSPGQALPTEIELCAALSVSRSALREAFRRLAAKGLLVSRQRVGTLVRPRSEWNVLDPEVLSWHLRVAPTDEFVSGLFEMRKIVEPSAAALAAERRNTEAVARISGALEDMFRFQDGKGDLIGADLRFHRSVLDSACNPFLGCFAAVIESSLVSSFRLSWGAGGRTPEYALRQHRGVFEAIRDGRPSDAYAVMTQLLRSAIEDVREALIQRRRRGEEAETGGVGLQPL